MKKFLVDPENISSSLSQALEYVQSSLKNYRLNPKQESRAVLMAEESLTLLMKYADFSHYGAFYVNVSKLFGSIRIKLIVPGKHSTSGKLWRLTQVLTMMVCPKLRMLYRTY